MAHYAEFLRQNPMRPPHWRWQRAEYLVASGQCYCRYQDDEITGEAVTYLRALTASAAQRQRQNSWLAIADTAQACELHGALEPHRSRVEARILANQSPHEIACRLPLTAGAVERYAALFFDVADRLDASCYIHLQVLRDPLHEETNLQRQVRALKLLAYYGGPLILEMAECALFGPTQSAPSTTEAAASDPQLAKIRLLADLLTMPEGESPTKLLRACDQMRNSTHMDGAYRGSPFLRIAERVVGETPLEVTRLLLAEEPIGSSKPAAEAVGPKDAQAA